MLRRTFQLIGGVGPSREKDLWSEGITSWERFPREGGRVALAASKDGSARERLALAAAALERRDLAALAAMVPKREHWRFYREFGAEACFFDIEADGTTAMAPTVVSLFHHGAFEIFVQGRNLDALPEALGRHRLWVTFNGTVFDVPVLRAYFPALAKPALHLDLRFVCRKMGWTGGLKRLESELGFPRPPHLLGVDGMAAVRLWAEYEATGAPERLRALVEYNLYDALQLRTLADRAYNQGLERLPPEVAELEPRVAVFERGDSLLDLSRALERFTR